MLKKISTELIIPYGIAQIRKNTMVYMNEQFKALINNIQKY